MFAVLLAATALGDPAHNPILYERLTERVVVALRSAADRHPKYADHLRTQAEFIRLDAEISRHAVFDTGEEASFLLNLIQSYTQLDHLAGLLADPVLDIGLLATRPQLAWALVVRYRWTNRDRVYQLPALAAWFSYQRTVRPAIARVVAFTSWRPLP